MKNRLIPYSPALKQMARKLRKDSTLSEILLWQKIKGRALGLEFHRQVPVNKYIVDFYCHELMLAIEIDGNTHDTPEAQKNDVIRQDTLESLGVTFIRFSDLALKKDIQNVLIALEGIVVQLKEKQGK